MSHNVKIQGVNIPNITILKRAVKEIAKEQGVEMTVTDDTTFRGWGNARTHADHVLKIAGCQYDVGFNKGKNGKLEPVVEDMAMRDVGRFIGSQDTAKAATEGAACDRHGVGAIIGRLTQRINVLTAENQAASNGMVTTREVNKETGLITLIATR